MLFISHFQNGVTLKRKEMLWQNIADSVNQCSRWEWSGCRPSEKEVERYEVRSHNRQRRNMITGGGCPFQEIQHDDVMRRIIGETTYLLSGKRGVSAKLKFQPAARSMRSF